MSSCANVSRMTELLRPHLAARQAALRPGPDQRRPGRARGDEEADARAPRPRAARHPPRPGRAPSPGLPGGVGNRPAAAIDRDLRHGGRDREPRRAGRHGHRGRQRVLRDADRRGRAALRRGRGPGHRGLGPARAQRAPARRARRAPARASARGRPRRDVDRHRASARGAGRRDAGQQDAADGRLRHDPGRGGARLRRLGDRLRVLVHPEVPGRTTGHVPDRRLRSRARAEAASAHAGPVLDRLRAAQGLLGRPPRDLPPHRADPPHLCPPRGAPPDPARGARAALGQAHERRPPPAAARARCRLRASGRARPPARAADRDPCPRGDRRQGGAATAARRGRASRSGAGSAHRRPRSGGSG